MNRRTFLKNLGLAGVAVAAPKFIFDVGKNLWRTECEPTPVKLNIIWTVLDEGVREIVRTAHEEYLITGIGVADPARIFHSERWNAYLDMFASNISSEVA